MAAVASAAVPWGACAQGFTADYDLARVNAADPASVVRLAPALSLGGDRSSLGLSLQAGRHWFGQVQMSHEAAGSLLPVSSRHWVDVGGGYRWGNGQSLSLQLSRVQGQRLGLAVNYDWPRYFVRLSYDPGLTFAPQDSLRFSAGVRF